MSMGVGFLGAGIQGPPCSGGYRAQVLSVARVGLQGKALASGERYALGRIASWKLILKPAHRSGVMGGK